MVADSIDLSVDTTYNYLTISSDIVIKLFWKSNILSNLTLHYDVSVTCFVETWYRHAMMTYVLQYASVYPHLNTIAMCTQNQSSS